MNNLDVLVKDYLTQQSTDYAILINGQWGSGKTHYWKNVVINQIKSVQYETGKDGEPVMYEPIYVSLFGVSSLAEMQSRLALEVIPFKNLMKSRVGKFGTFLAKTVVNKAGDFFGTGGIGDEERAGIFELLTNFKPNKVLCFDDLERVAPDVINDVLGYINQFVEHDKLKVVLLADERELLKNCSELYPRVKEKLIRFTFQFNPEIETVFDSFLGAYDDPIYSAFAKRNKRLVVTAFHNGGHRNMRTLRFALDLFKKVHDYVNLSSEVKDEYKNHILDSLFLFLMSYAIEYKKDPSSVDLKEIETISSYDLIDEDFFQLLAAPAPVYDAVQPVEVTPSELYRKAFKKAYLHIHGYEFFQFFPSLRDFIHTGYLDDKVLIQELKAKQEDLDREKLTGEQKLLNQFTHGILIDDDEYEEVLGEVLEKAKKGEFAVQTYYYLVQQLLRMEKDGMYGFKLLPPIVADLKRGIEVSYSNRSEKARLLPSYDLNAPGVDDRYAEIFSFLKELQQEDSKKELQEYANGLVKAITDNDIDEMTRLLDGDEMRNLPFLQYVSPTDAVSALTFSKNETKYHFEQSLQNRFPSKFIMGRLESERNFLECLDKELAKYLETQKTMKMSVFNLNKIKELTKELISRGE